MASGRVSRRTRPNTSMNLQTAPFRTCALLEYRTGARRGRDRARGWWTHLRDEAPGAAKQCFCGGGCHSVSLMDRDATSSQITQGAKKRISQFVGVAWRRYLGLLRYSWARCIQFRPARCIPRVSRSQPPQSGPLRRLCLRQTSQEKERRHPSSH